MRWLLLSAYLGPWLPWQIGHPSPFRNSGQPDKSTLALYQYEVQYMWVLNTCTCTKQIASNKWLHITETKQLRAIFNWNMFSTLSYSLKLVVRKCIIEYYIKQPDMLIVWSKFFQNMKVIIDIGSCFLLTKTTSKLHCKNSIWRRAVSFHSKAPCYNTSQEANSENVLIFHFLKKLWVEAGNIA